MNSNQRTLLLFILGLTLVVGCTHFHQTLVGDEKTYSVTRPGSIQVFLGNESPPRTYEEVGYIVAQETSEKDAVTFLKEKAAGMGADALLNCEVRVNRRLAIIIVFIPIFEDTHIASGVAIRYTNPLMKGE